MKLQPKIVSGNGNWKVITGPLKASVIPATALHKPKTNGNVWKLSCTHCDTIAYLTTKEYTADRNQCRCRKSGARERSGTSLSITRTLTIDGVTKSIKDWALQTGIPLGSIRTRLYSRVDETDEQVLFGKKEKMQDLSKLILNLVNTHEALNESVNVVIRQMNARKSEAIKLDKLAGYYLPIKTGETNSYLGDLLTLGYSINEITTLLQQQKFTNITEKWSKLSPFIDVIDEGFKYLTDLEICQLLSLKGKKDV